MDTVTVESGDRSSVVYIDPLQAIRSMQMDKLIQEDVIDPMDKFIVSSALMQCLNLQSISRPWSMMQNGIRRCRVTTKISSLISDDEDLESHIYSSDDIAL